MEKTRSNVALKDLDALQVYQEESAVHYDKRQFDSIKNSLMTYGQLRPVVLAFDEHTRHHYIVDGRKLIEAARQLHLQSLECVTYTVANASEIALLYLSLCGVNGMYNFVSVSEVVRKGVECGATIKSISQHLGMSMDKAKLILEIT
jgi:hypothetical protein